MPSDLSRPTAVVYCEANFGLIDGKTANGLVRHSETYEILSVIDSTQAGLDTGVVLGDAGREQNDGNGEMFFQVGPYVHRGQRRSG